MLMASNDFSDPALRPWGHGRAAQRQLVFERARSAVDASERRYDEAKRGYERDNNEGEQYDITEDERDRYGDYENQDDDECMRQMNAQHKYRFVADHQNRVVHYESAHYLMAPAVEPCFQGRNEDLSRREIPIQSQGVQDALSNYMHEQIRFSDISEIRGDRYSNDGVYKASSNIGADMHAGRQHNYSRYPGEASLYGNNTFGDRNKSREPDTDARDRVYDANNRTNLGIHDLGRQGLIRPNERAAELLRDPLNTAMYEPRNDPRNEQGSRFRFQRSTNTSFKYF